jgi:hypothetical protein
MRIWIAARNSIKQYLHNAATSVANGRIDKGMDFRLPCWLIINDDSVLALLHHVDVGDVANFYIIGPVQCLLLAQTRHQTPLYLSLPILCKIYTRKLTKLHTSTLKMKVAAAPELLATSPISTWRNNRMTEHHWTRGVSCIKFRGTKYQKVTYVSE